MSSYKWVISPLTQVINILALLITPLLTTPEPPSTGECEVSSSVKGVWRLFGSCGSAVSTGRWLVIPW